MIEIKSAQFIDDGRKDIILSFNEAKVVIEKGVYSKFGFSYADMQNPLNIARFLTALAIGIGSAKPKENNLS